MYSVPCFIRPSKQEFGAYKTTVKYPKEKFVIVIDIDQYNKSTSIWQNGWSLLEDPTELVSLFASINMKSWQKVKLGQVQVDSNIAQNQLSSP